ncbi:TetR/AcrR family transcriptional regulator [Paracoccus nototheniae]|uniref:TetR/AcrR family transcriptional regulator n=1 Tax=Paracoccus nototheniae TaxID=2489002 RepID=A0ABW4DXB6_9RHOB|nr:TetR/AcrR family transcriptional regulator [Paracoccus nototheniae]
MKVSRDQMTQNRSRILDQAACLFRDKGFEAVSVAQIMKAAGLTHGGFYGHFASKDDLIAQTMAHALSAQDQTTPGIGAVLGAYLSPAHRDAPATGCPVAAFASDARRQTPGARAAMAEGIRAQIARMTDALDRPDARDAAIAGWSAAVGAMILSRAIDDTALSDEILNGTQRWLLAALEPASDE